jgi:hypothetical protein
MIRSTTPTIAAATAAIAAATINASTIAAAMTAKPSSASRTRNRQHVSATLRTVEACQREPPRAVGTPSTVNRSAINYEQVPALALARPA